MNKLKPQLPDVWGGIECTINRVEHRYTDQLALSGFYDHPDYLDPIIGLGIKHLRFPILWERHQPTRSGNIDWTFTTDCLQQVKDAPRDIGGRLLHHGSGRHLPTCCRMISTAICRVCSGGSATVFMAGLLYTG